MVSERCPAGRPGLRVRQGGAWQLVIGASFPSEGKLAGSKKIEHGLEPEPQGARECPRSRGLDLCS